MTKTEMKLAAQDALMQHMAGIGYGDNYEELVEKIGDRDLAEQILKSQMDRVARMFGYKESWFG